MQLIGTSSISQKKKLTRKINQIQDKSSPIRERLNFFVSVYFYSNQLFKNKQLKQFEKILNTH